MCDVQGAARTFEGSTDLWAASKAEITAGIAADQADGAKANHVDAGGMRGQRGESFTASRPTLTVARI